MANFGPMRTTGALVFQSRPPHIFFKMRKQRVSTLAITFMAWYSHKFISIQANNIFPDTQADHEHSHSGNQASTSSAGEITYKW
jgi:hypothetical protein